MARQMEEQGQKSWDSKGLDLSSKFQKTSGFLFSLNLNLNKKVGSMMEHDEKDGGGARP